MTEEPVHKPQLNGSKEDRSPAPPPKPSKQIDPLGLLKRRDKHNEVSSDDIGGVVGYDPILTGAGLSIRALIRRIRGKKA